MWQPFPRGVSYCGVSYCGVSAKPLCMFFNLIHYTDNPTRQFYDTLIYASLSLRFLIIGILY
jgi:hypothetical protein